MCLGCAAGHGDLTTAHLRTPHKIYSSLQGQYRDAWFSWGFLKQIGADLEATTSLVTLVFITALGGRGEALVSGLGFRV